MAYPSAKRCRSHSGPVWILALTTHHSIWKGIKVASDLCATFSKGLLSCIGDNIVFRVMAIVEIQVVAKVRSIAVNFEPNLDWRVE